ncbi:MAG: hypothetical protein AAGF11_25515 [Myxococcota bacterium]
MPEREGPEREAPEREGPEREGLGSLASSLSQALAPAFDRPEPAQSLAQELAAEVRNPDDPEASVRWSPDGTIGGGRMMLERVSLVAVRRLAAGLALPWPEPCERLGRACERLGLPVIGGWDVGSGRARYKLYANASDASATQQRRLAEVFAWRGAEPPQVLGLNVAAERGGIERKVYLQRPSRGALERSIGHALELPSALEKYDAPTTWVASLDLTDSSAALRAVFVAAHDGAQPAAERLVHALTGVRWARLAEHLPFVPGPLRQVGWGVDGRVTAYAKPAGTAAPVHALAPHAIFVAGRVEVGLYIEPSARTPRAFARTAQHALTLRERAGRAPGPWLERLGRWAQAQVFESEQRGGAPRLDHPPAPWRCLAAERSG